VKYPAILVFLLVLTSCSTVYFSTIDHLEKEPYTNHVSKYEVSVGEWITYIVVTSFTQRDTAIYLSDHLDQINSKLPELKIPGWSNYVVSAFLRKDGKMVIKKVFDHCTGNHLGIYIPESAWDSIAKFNLYDAPVVAITYEQALDYIQYKQHYINSCHLNTKRNTHPYECLLPTRGEYDSIQSEMDSLNDRGCNLFNYKNSFCFDCPTGKKFKNHPVLSKTGIQPTYVYGYFPNDFGLFNFKGNVAEMTSEKGIAKGGSCIHYASEASIGESQAYSKPELWLGFRVWFKANPK